jgi:hypothetical protein
MDHVPIYFCLNKKSKATIDQKYYEKLIAVSSTRIDVLMYHAGHKLHEECQREHTKPFEIPKCNK